jgi:hypothetical protein
MPDGTGYPSDNGLAKVSSILSIGSSPVDAQRSSPTPCPIRSNPTAVADGRGPRGKLCCKDRTVDPPPES